MRNLPLAAKAGLLLVLLGLAAKESAHAQIPAQPADESASLNPTPGENSSQQLVTNPAPPPPPSSSNSESWLDRLFAQKLPINLGFRLGGAYSDNIFYQPKNKVYDYITEYSPTIGLTLGQEIKLNHQLDEETIDILTDAGNLNYLNVVYTPTLRLFDRNQKLDDVDEDADGVYSHLFGKLTLSLEQSYEKLSQPTVQINTQGGLIDRDVFTTTARANYVYSDRLSTYGTVTQTVNTYISNVYTDNTEWLADYYFLYQLFPKLSIGVGPRIGFEDIDKAPNQTFQAGLVHLYFLATSKVTVDGAFGAEIREFEHDSSPTDVTPIAEGTIAYQPFDSLTIKLDGERHRIVAAGQLGDDYTASVATLEVKQRFFQVAYLIVDAGYEDDEYTLTPFDSVNGEARDDNIFFLHSGLEWTSYRGITVDAGYSYLRDDSNVHAFTFTENRFNVSATLKY